MDKDGNLDDSAITADMITMRQGSKSYLIGRQEIPGYEIIEPLGWGGMGTVWKARQKSLGRSVALKILHDHLVCDEIFAARFLLEAQSLACLTHPNIIQIYDVGQTDNHFFYAMEHVAGKDLASIIVERKKLDPALALEITQSVAMALSEAHRKQIIHRDIKPHNILITRSKLVKLTDFGLAKHIQQDLSITAPHTMVGSPKYMAPEQLLKNPKSDIRTDIYSLGVTLYNMVVGSCPFEGSSPLHTFKSISEGDYLPPQQARPDLSKPISDLIDKMMHIEPEERYQNCEELIAEIDSIRSQKYRSTGITTTTQNYSSIILEDKENTQRRVTQIDLRTRRRTFQGKALTYHIFLGYRGTYIPIAEPFISVPMEFSTVIKLEETDSDFWLFEICEGKASDPNKILARIVVLASALQKAQQLNLYLRINEDGKYRFFLQNEEEIEVSFILQYYNPISIKESYEAAFNTEM